MPTPCRGESRRPCRFWNRRWSEATAWASCWSSPRGSPGSARRISAPAGWMTQSAGRACPGSCPGSQGARQRGVGPPPARRDRLARRPSRRETAEGHYREALALATELGMRPLVAHCHLGLGKLYRRTGDGAKAAGAPDHRDDDVPRDGHGVLAGEGGGGAGWSRAMTRVLSLGQLDPGPPRRAARCRGAAGGEGLPDRVALVRQVRTERGVRRGSARGCAATTMRRGRTS